MWRNETEGGRRSISLENAWLAWEAEDDEGDWLDAVCVLELCVSWTDDVRLWLDVTIGVQKTIACGGAGVCSITNAFGWSTIGCDFDGWRTRFEAPLLSELTDAPERPEVVTSCELCFKVEVSDACFVCPYDADFLSAASLALSLLFSWSIRSSSFCLNKEEDEVAAVSARTSALAFLFRAVIWRKPANGCL